MKQTGHEVFVGANTIVSATADCSSSQDFQPGDIAISTAYTINFNTPFGYSVVEGVSVSGTTATYVVNGLGSAGQSFVPQVICADLTS